MNEHLTKQEIIEVVDDNRDLLQEAADEIISRGCYSVYVSTAEKGELLDHPEIEGLYSIISKDRDDDRVYESIDDDVFDRVLGIHGIEFISFDPDFKEFGCGGSGFGPGTHYYGFYYAEDDVPAGIWGEDFDLTESGDGWIWEEGGSGDNRYYTEKILDNWYYYEMHF